ncbi:hypothetical protein ACE1CI_09830 [Aerosakkonemataceae cyanobacterium BLCC-F50]|uniref:DUF4276 family protein n=1 Tax=Floridaenema flaviceps BLCC-F50 TaxID=3153642 RepID=A0ABV4XNA6_9CYAN
MNIYFLVEGKRTERKVYPAWLAYLLPELQRVQSYDEVDKNNYYLFSGEGYPSIIYDHIPNAIEDIRSIGKYNYFVVCLDAEESSVNDIREEVDGFLQSEKIDLDNTQMVLIIQNRCIETWFLGNRKIYTRNPQSPHLLNYTRYYNVETDCPEKMGKYQNFNTHAQFHEAYLKALFEEKRISYSKKNPGAVLQEYYLQELRKRTEAQLEHLPSFQYFIEFCKMIKSQLQS